MEKNREPKINPHLCSHLIYDKGDRSIQWDKDSFLNKWCLENWTDTCKNETGPLFYTIYKNNKLEMN